MYFTLLCICNDFRHRLNRLQFNLCNAKVIKTFLYFFQLFSALCLCVCFFLTKNKFLKYSIIWVTVHTAYCFTCFILFCNKYLILFRETKNRSNAKKKLLIECITLCMQLFFFFPATWTYDIQIQEHIKKNEFVGDIICYTNFLTLRGLTFCLLSSTFQFTWRLLGFDKLQDRCKTELHTISLFLFVFFFLPCKSGVCLLV